MNWQQQDNNKQIKSMNQMVDSKSTKTGRNNQPKSQPSSHSSAAVKKTHLFPLNSPAKNSSISPTHDNSSHYHHESYNSHPVQEQLEPVSPQPSRRNHSNHTPPRSKNRRPKRRKKKSPPTSNPLSVFLLVIVRLLVVIIGISAIWGTTLSIFNSTNSPKDEQNIATTETAQAATNKAEQSLDNLLLSTSLGNKLSSLETKITNLAAQYNQLQPGVFLVDLDNNGYVNIQGETAFSSASTIKVPVLVALFQELDRGTVRLDEQLVMSKELIAGGSGNMQYEEPGKQFSVLETATKMIVISDNTATNMLIERLGGG